jgi:hypothetical protein
MKSKQQNQIYGISKIEYVIFYYKVLIVIFILPKTVCFKKNKIPLDFPSLGNPNSYHHDSKPTKIQNSYLQCSMSRPYPKCLVHPNHVIILPPLTMNLALGLPSLRI